MKVLFAVPYIYDSRYKEFTRNATGFGILMKQIYENISQKNEGYLISHVLTKGQGNILKHTLGSVICHMQWKDLVQGIKWALHYKQSICGRLRYLYFCMNKGYVRYTIRQLQPEVVHINSVGMQNKTYIEVCEELGIKYVITLHGLIGIDDTVKAPKWDKIHEKEVVLECERRKIPMTVISTGIKDRIEKHYLNGQPTRCITVVPNGTDIEPRNSIPETDIRKTYHIPDDAVIAVSVGTVNKNKNQMQIVDAMPLICKDSDKDLYVLLCGTDCTDGAVQKRIDELGLTDRVIMLGYVPYEQMGDIYAQADFNILASINEGFGLGIIEAFVYGLPAVTFADLDAIPDIYNEKAMVLSEKRDTKSFAEAIIKTMNTQWDAENIRAYSKNFSLEKMAENYQRVYEQIVR